MKAVTSDDLFNRGIIRINDVPPTDETTVLVVGLPRSGTSMVASVLKELGVYIGTKVDNVVFEDREIAAALDAGNTDQLDKLISQRNAQYRIWGFKRPEAYKKLASLCAICRNPRVIITFRDILAIALRNRISMQLDPLLFLPQLAVEYHQLAIAIRKLSAPCLLISYEKALQFPEQTVSEIAAFSGIAADDKKTSAAISVIENGAPRYIEAARLRYQGSVGRLVKSKLRGWVKVQHQDRVRVVVELEINGAVIGTMTADLYRPDVEQAGFGDGRYGFEFPIDDAIDPKSVVNVRVQNSKILVTNSGRALQSYRFPPQ